MSPILLAAGILSQEGCVNGNDSGKADDTAVQDTAGDTATDTAADTADTAEAAMFDTVTIDINEDEGVTGDDGDSVFSNVDDALAHLNDGNNGGTVQFTSGQNIGVSMISISSSSFTSITLKSTDAAHATLYNTADESAILSASGVNVTISGLTFEGLNATSSSVAVFLTGGKSTLSDVTIRDIGVGLSINGATVSADNLLVEVIQSSAILVAGDDSAVGLTNLTVDTAVTGISQSAGAVDIETASFTALTDTVISTTGGSISADGVTASAAANGVVVSGAEVELTNSNFANLTGEAIDINNTDYEDRVVLENVTVSDSLLAGAHAVGISAADLTISGLKVTGVDALASNLVGISTQDADISGVIVNNNTVATAPVSINVVAGGNTDVHNAAIKDNTYDGGDTILEIESAGNVGVRNVAIDQNSAPTNGSESAVSLTATEGGSVTFKGNIITGNANVNGDLISGAVLGDESQVVVGYNMYDDNGGSVDNLDETNVGDNPMYIDSSTGAINDLELLEGSPAIDAGDSDYRYRDEDGSIGDLGAHGGNGASALETFAAD